MRSAPEAFQGPPAPVFFGPERWIAGDGALEAAAPLLRAWPRPLGLLGEAGLLKSLRRPLTRAWLEAGVELELLGLEDGSDCSAGSVAGALERARARGVGGLIGLGGGRVLDLAKLAAFEAGWPLATVPTSAATCACATGVAVVNDGRGGFAEVRDLGGPPGLCIVELGILRAAPARLLAAGMADTLAKWMEWRALEPEPGAFGAGAGWALASRAFDCVRAAGAEALKEPGSRAFAAAVEACLLWSAAASCAGAAPAAAAHSLANALSRQGPGAALLHGEAVGLGLLWQESLLEASGSATMGSEALARLLASWGLPTALPAGLDHAALESDAFAPGETVHLLGQDAAARAALAAFSIGR
jgi:glycerol dehydrogenase-like iron-containing ADH family enzyme